MFRDLCQEGKGGLDMMSKVGMRFREFSGLVGLAGYMAFR